MLTSHDASDAAIVPVAAGIRRGVIVALAMIHFALASAVALAPVHAGSDYWGSRLLTGLVVGSAFAQISLSAAWCALGPGTFFLRVPLSLLFAILAGLALSVFLLKTSGGNDFWFSVALTLLGWLLLQPPLWLVSIGLKYRVSVRGDQVFGPTIATQFTLAHMLLWTFGVALLLGIGRMALGNAKVSTYGGWSIVENSIFLIFLVINLLLAIPVILAILRWSCPIRRFLATAGWSVTLGVVEGLCLTLLTGSGFEPLNLALTMIINVVHCGVLGGSLFALTMVGYRLQRESGPFSGTDLAIASKD